MTIFFYLYYVNTIVKSESPKQVSCQSQKQLFNYIFFKILHEKVNLAFQISLRHLNLDESDLPFHTDWESAIKNILEGLKHMNKFSWLKFHVRLIFCEPSKMK